MNVINKAAATSQCGADVLHILTMEKLALFLLLNYNCMKTLIVHIPDKDENLILSLFKKFRFKATVLTNEDLEDEALAKWIDEGMRTEDIPEEEIFDLLRKHGIKI